MALVQTVMHCPEEVQRLAALQEQEDQLMTRAEDLWKKISEVQQGTGIPESALMGSKWEAAKKVGQCQALRRGKVSLLLPTPGNCLNCCGSRVRADAFTVTPEGDTDQREDTSTSPMSKDSMERRGHIASTNSLV